MWNIKPEEGVVIQGNKGGDRFSKNFIRLPRTDSLGQTKRRSYKLFLVTLK